jgi:DNA-binding NtrC family response regulator
MIKQKLLLVDDEDRHLRSLRMLFYENYDVRTTTDPQEALRILRDELIHVIVCDLDMPLMSGLELLRIACKTSPSTMRILLSDTTEWDDYSTGGLDGVVFRCLLKPWDAKEVTSSVAEAAALAEACFAVKSHKGTSAESGKPKPRVLVIDQEVSVIETVQATLADRCSIVWASDANHAMEEISRQNISIVVSEIMLGDTDVTYILKTIKQHNPLTQCIVVTSFTESADLLELINQAHINRFMHKPFSKGMLSRHLEFLLDQFLKARAQNK